MENQLFKMGQGAGMHLHGGQSTNAVFPGNAHTAVRGKVQCTFTSGFRRTVGLWQLNELSSGRSGCLSGGLPQTVAVDEPDEFQLLKQCV